MDFDTQPTPGGGVPGDYPGKPKHQQSWMDDLPGRGSEGPTDIPNKDDSCPTCGQPHKGGVRKDNPVQKPQNPLSTPGQYRGEQQGRGGHFGAGHQKRLIPGTNTPWGNPQRHPRRTSPIDKDSTAEERYQRERLMGGDFPYGKDDKQSREGGYTGPYPAGDPSN